MVVRSHQRRLSDSGVLHSSELNRSLLVDGGGRHRLSRRPRKPRSWHPSPYVSDEDDELVHREERRHKIKQEISRRRHHLEENSSLHDELMRLARLRETAELGLEGRPDLTVGSIAARDTGGHSVLKSIEEIMRDEGYSRRVPDTGLSYYSSPPARKLDFGNGGKLSRKLSSNSDEERSMNRLASTFNANDMYYDSMPEYTGYGKSRPSDAGALYLSDAGTGLRARQSQRVDEPSARKVYKGKYDRRWH